MKASIRDKLVVILLLFTIIPILISGAFSFFLAQRVLQSKINELSNNLLDDTIGDIDNRIVKLWSYMNQLMANHHFVDLVYNSDFTLQHFGSYQARVRLDEIVKPYLLDHGINAAFLSSSRGSHIVFGYFKESWQFLDNPWYQRVTESRSSALISRLIDNPNASSRYQSVIACGWNLRVPPAEEKAVFAFLVDPEFFEKILPHQNGEEIHSIITYRNTVFAQSTDAPGLDAPGVDAPWVHTTTTVGGTRYIVLHRKSEQSDFEVFQLIPRNYYFREIGLIFVFNIAVVLACIIFSVAASIFVSQRLSLPIRALTEAMKFVSTKNFDVRLPDKSQDEFGIINRGFNRMAQDLKKLFRTTVLKEKQKREAQIALMQYQINPHFLHNTLSSIRSISLIKGDEKTAETISILGRLLSYTLSRDTALVTVSEEIVSINDYLALMQIRYDDRINSRIDIQADIDNCLLPSMLFQPILENAILHGLNEKVNSGPGEAKLTLTGFQRNGSLFFEIEDNGCGMKEKTIREAFQKNRKAIQGHIGIRNIHDRIRYQFGSRYGLSIDSRIDAFTRVRIKLPVVRSRR